MLGGGGETEQVNATQPREGPKPSLSLPPLGAEEEIDRSRSEGRITRQSLPHQCILRVGGGGGGRHRGSKDHGQQPQRQPQNSLQVLV